MEMKRLKRREHEKVRRGVGRYDCRQVCRHGEVVNISTNPVFIVYVMGGEHKAQKRNKQENARAEVKRSDGGKWKRWV